MRFPKKYEKKPDQKKLKEKICRFYYNIYL